MVRVAFGTLDAWNALSASGQAYYDGGHYLLLASALVAHPGALASDDYYYGAISDTDNSQTVTMPSNTNGYNIYVYGNGFCYSVDFGTDHAIKVVTCLLYTSPSPRDS